MAERPEQPRCGAILVAHAGVQRADDRADGTAQRYPVVRDQGGQRNPLSVSWATASTRRRPPRIPRSTCRAHLWEAATAQGTTSMPRTTSSSRTTPPCWRASTCSNSGAGCGRSATTAYATANFNGTFTFNSLDAYQITEQGHCGRMDPGTDSRRGRRGGTVLDYLRDTVHRGHVLRRGIVLLG